jgi:hypothetical protein
LKKITPKTSIENLAALVSQALIDAGIDAVLTGGAAVSIYTRNLAQRQTVSLRAIRAWAAVRRFYRASEKGSVGSLKRSPENLAAPGRKALMLQ